jgi:hypothetical protein
MDKCCGVFSLQFLPVSERKREKKINKTLSLIMHKKNSESISPHSS